MESHPVERVIVTRPDHDFVKLTIKRVGKVVAATVAAIVVGVNGY